MSINVKNNKMDTGHLFFKTINFKYRFNYIKIKRYTFQPLFKRPEVVGGKSTVDGLFTADHWKNY
jgi:hypothetical protein